MTEPMYRQIAEDLRPRSSPASWLRAASLPPRSSSGSSTARRGTPSATRSSGSLPWAWSRPARARAPSSIEKINPFVTTLTGDPTPDVAAGKRAVYLAEVAASGRTPTISQPGWRSSRPTRSSRRALRIEEGAQVVQPASGTLHRWHPLVTADLVLSHEPGAGGAPTGSSRPTDIDEGAVAYLATSVRYPAGRATATRSRYAPPDETEASFFKLPADGRVSVFEIFRVGFDKDANRIRLTITVYPADRNRFRVNVGQVPTGR